jgi:hypothetical protein
MNYGDAGSDALDENDVGEYIDSRDLKMLRHSWDDDDLFIQVAVHVAECPHCLKRRCKNLRSWVTGSPPYGVP